MKPSGRGRHRQLWRAALLVAAAVTLLPQFSMAASVSWQSWTFDEQISGNNDGLSLANVKFQGRLLIKKLSFPVMRVFYDNDACGPYADRLGGTVVFERCDDLDSPTADGLASVLAALVDKDHGPEVTVVCRGRRLKQLTIWPRL